MTSRARAPGAPRAPRAARGPKGLSELPYDLNELFADEIAPALRETCAAPLKRLGVTAREPLGCGAFGCVFPTKSTATVVKLTCQAEEVALARFFARALAAGETLPASIPRVYEVVELSCASLSDEVRSAALRYEGRVLPICAGPAFAIKREELHDITNPMILEVFDWAASSQQKLGWRLRALFNSALSMALELTERGQGLDYGVSEATALLRREMHRSPDLESKPLLEAFTGLQDGLLFLKRAGITARDVSRDNLVLRPVLRPVLRDFGLFHRSGFGFDAAAAGGEDVAEDRAEDRAEDEDVVDFSLDGLGGAGTGLGEGVDVGGSPRRPSRRPSRRPPSTMRGLGALASCGH